MASAFDVLAKDHEEVKRMLTELELGPTAATGANSDQLALRKKKVQQLVIEESKHEAVEEMYFWPAVREALTDGTDLANQAQDQEQEGKVVLDRLDKLAPEDDEFEALLAQFTSAGRAHIAFEEARRLAGPAVRAHHRAGRQPRTPAGGRKGKRTHPAAPQDPGLACAAQGSRPGDRRHRPAQGRGDRPRPVAGSRPVARTPCGPTWPPGAVLAAVRLPGSPAGHRRQC